MNPELHTLTATTGHDQPARNLTIPRIAALLVILAATIASLVVTPSRADAWTYAFVNGRAGSVSVPQVLAVDDGQYTTYGPYLTLRSHAGPTVHRSPATSGPQNVGGIYVVQQWDGSRWVEVTRQSTGTYRIPAGYNSVQLPRFHRSPRTQRGYFRVVWIFGWDNADTGAGLGNTVITPSVTSDFHCATSARPCASSAHWMRIGRTYALGGGW